MKTVVLTQFQEDLYLASAEITRDGRKVFEGIFSHPLITHKHVVPTFRQLARLGLLHFAYLSRAPRDTGGSIVQIKLLVTPDELRVTRPPKPARSPYKPSEGEGDITGLKIPADRWDAHWKAKTGNMTFDDEAKAARPEQPYRVLPPVTWRPAADSLG